MKKFLSLTVLSCAVLFSGIVEAGAPEAKKLLSSIAKTEAGIVSLGKIDDKGKAVLDDDAYEALFLAFHDVGFVKGVLDKDSYVTKGYNALTKLKGNELTNNVNEEMFLRVYADTGPATRYVLLDRIFDRFVQKAGDASVKAFVEAAKNEKSPEVQRTISAKLAKEGLFEKKPAFKDLPLIYLSSKEPLTRYHAVQALAWNVVEKDKVLAHLAQEKDAQAFNAVDVIGKYGSDDVADFLIKAYKDPAHEASANSIILGLTSMFWHFPQHDTYNEKAYRAVLDFLDPVNYAKKNQPSLFTFAGLIRENNFQAWKAKASWYKQADLVAALKKCLNSDLCSAANKRSVETSLKKLGAE
jgi:hypothetical protein